LMDVRDSQTTRYILLQYNFAVAKDYRVGERLSIISEMVRAYRLSLDVPMTLKLDMTARKTDENELDKMLETNNRSVLKTSYKIFITEVINEITALVEHLNLLKNVKQL
ncbi:hypothetical protein PV325_013100, partial [Microctonus aethiopoides]